MDWSLPTDSPPSPTEGEGLARAWRGYQAALSHLSIPELMEHLASINAAMEAQARQSLAQAISSSPSLTDYLASVDRLSPSSGGTASQPWPTDRGEPPSPSPQPSAVDRLARSARLGPRLANRLVLASARAAQRRDEG